MTRKDPPSDEAAPPPRLLSPAFWLALAFGLACILAALAVVFTARHARPTAIAAPAAPAAALDASPRA